MNSNDLVIGTANFGHKYGIDGFRVGLNNISKIFKLMNDNKINYIDTALGYKNCATVLGKVKLDNFNVITKIGKIPKKKKGIEKLIFRKILNSKKKLKIKKFYAILIHHSETMLQSNSNIIYNSLVKLKNLKITKKIGFSTYDPTVAKKILNLYNFDIIQFPVNYLDRRFLKTNFISFIKKKKLEIQARSIFLQGSLLKDYKLLPYYLRKWKSVWINFEKLALSNSVSKFQLCISFIQNLIDKGIIDKIVIGINDEKQLNEIINAVNLKKHSIVNFKKIITKKNLIDPRKWVYVKKN